MPGLFGSLLGSLTSWASTSRLQRLFRMSLVVGTWKAHLGRTPIERPYQSGQVVAGPCSMPALHRPLLGQAASRADRSDQQGRSLFLEFSSFRFLAVAYSSGSSARTRAGFPPEKGWGASRCTANLWGGAKGGDGTLEALDTDDLPQRGKLTVCVR